MSYQQRDPNPSSWTPPSPSPRFTGFNRPRIMTPPLLVKPAHTGTNAQTAWCWLSAAVDNFKRRHQTTNIRINNSLRTHARSHKGTQLRVYLPQQIKTKPQPCDPHRIHPPTHTHLQHGLSRAPDAAVPDHAPAAGVCCLPRSPASGLHASRPERD